MQPRFPATLLASIAAAAAAALPAAAAEITPHDIPGESATFIAIEGELRLGDEKRFANIAIGVENAIVGFSSPGGNLIAGIEIGKAIRMKEFSTIVLAEFDCSSACALAWLGGARRFMEPRSMIGFHAARNLNDRECAADSVGNALVGAYLNQLGLRQSAIAYITEMSPCDVQWLTVAAARQHGIELDELDLANDLPDDPPSPTPASAPPQESGAAGSVWVQIFSRATLSEAIPLATQYQSQLNSDASVFGCENGWYTIAIGPFSARTATTLLQEWKSAAVVPDDSFVTGLSSCRSFAWGSRPPSIDATGYEREALDAALAYYRDWSLPNSDALDRVWPLFPAQMLYFGEVRSKAEVMQEKAAFAVRWPERDYTVRANTVSVHCRNDSSCEVSGIVDWRASSPERQSTSVGSATFTLVFSGVNPPVISSEDSTVLTRTLSGHESQPGTARGSAPQPDFRVTDVSVDDFLNMRSGPGRQFPAIAALPWNARGITVHQCLPVSGYSKKWCQISWQTYEGWASACCLFNEQSRKFAD